MALQDRLPWEDLLKGADVAISEMDIQHYESDPAYAGFAKTAKMAYAGSLGFFAFVMVFMAAMPYIHRPAGADPGPQFTFMGGLVYGGVLFAVALAGNIAYPIMVRKWLLRSATPEAAFGRVLTFRFIRLSMSLAGFLLGFTVYMVAPYPLLVVPFVLVYAVAMYFLAPTRKHLVADLVRANERKPSPSAG